jgi:NAD(P)-dependent dehydrogenase (short-subunit alcohol dehydrogenase family)
VSGKPRTALVTGSASGIGRALALALAGDGIAVAIHYRSSRDEAETTAAAARTFGVEAIALQADVTDPEAAASLVQRAHTAFGRLDVLINNVGNYVKGPLVEFAVDDWHAMFDSNLHATFYTCRTAVPLMRAQGGGRILNLGYAGSELVKARPAIAAYGIAKTGVILYSKALARSVARDGITVNVLSPGVIENSLTKPLTEIPMRRAGSLDELVAAARYLLSDEARYTTGVTIEVAGGWNL